MSARVCLQCSECWPNVKQYFHCPRCEVRTRLSTVDAPLPSSEAKELLSSYDGFRRFVALGRYSRWAADDERWWSVARTRSPAAVLGSVGLVDELERIPTLEEA